ncbi:hypothetical protein LINPERHAP1_LOCUS30855 [Linum perenne]
MGKKRVTDTSSVLEIYTRT